MVLGSSTVAVTSLSDFTRNIYVTRKFVRALLYVFFGVFAFFNLGFLSPAFTQ